MKNVNLITLGCPKNQVDSEYMKGLLSKEDGFKIVNEADNSDVIVINTCGFINDAKEESIETILDAVYYKKNADCNSIVVTGCLTQRYKETIIEEIPEVDAILGTGNFDQLSRVIQETYEGGKVSEISSPSFGYKHQLPRQLTDKHYAYLKIAEGCDNNCTYCTIPKIRGPLVSRTMEDIVIEAEQLAKSSVKEIIVVAQDITQYGIDIYSQPHLVQLLEKLVEIEGIEWIRLMYTYPERISDDLIKMIKNEEKICDYLDIPIQHSSQKIRQKMGRRGSQDDILDLVSKLREEIPDITLRTSLIVGFPGEDKLDFEQLYDFVKDVRFSRLGVFKYSKEEDTLAFNMECHISDKIKENRYDKIMNIQKEISLAQNREKVGNILTVIVDSVEEDHVIARSQYDAPEVDNQIILDDNDQEGYRVGEMVQCRVKEAYEYDLIAERIGENIDEFTE
jgi:ribosomal protein S12 methylthiotransferase